MSSPKRALVTGITGQDGAYLARHLLERGYHVTGGMRRTSTRNVWRLETLGIEDKINYVNFDLLDHANIIDVIDQVQPDEIYNLAAQSFVGVSFDQPTVTADIDGLGVCRIIDAMVKTCRHARFYQASTSEMFGKVHETPQRETTRFHPRSPYGVAKVYAHWITVNYRESYDMHLNSGILFNHESPLRGEEFVTRKITTTLAKIKAGAAMVLELGNMASKRDWGFAGDYVEGMHLMLQQDVPDDYVLATGETHTVREFVDLAAQAAGLMLEWHGEGLDEVAVDRATGQTVVQVNPTFFRPAEVDLLLGDSSKARTVLGWQPKVSFEGLVEKMIHADLTRHMSTQVYSIGSDSAAHLAQPDDRSDSQRAVG